ncbi:respiratory nitrate reductase subunit gamma [Calderihabitans maritimus]|uniref:Nitrate reductase subunit gamma n=1 Tax=Calderihabitans maritimus TaxID=1246530 RepID=A0A1Z5HQG2_9FIRM|nr:respiratory nitrate reductase subunit gamma [Calderihabitans maritimus]GAW91769.1 nitrate reductase subunit gamma [Calderihabitans maritimus]
MLLLVFMYISLFAFIILSLSKAMKYAKMPMHSRWELYPVPKEKGRGEYGGSYYEEVKWWEKPRETSLAGEIKEMLKEMLFIKNLFINQRPLWWLSYALHLGIYLLALWTVLLFIGAITEIAGLPMVTETGVNKHWWAALIYYCTLFTGSIGTILAAVGAGGLFLKRVFNETLKKYTTPQEYFNLLFIFTVLVTGLIVWSSDPAFNYGRDIMKRLLTFSAIQADTALTVHIVLLGLLLIYIPLSKMSHYVGKYFTFHKVLWDNDPNLPGSEVENKVKEAGRFKPSKSWSAPHCKTGETNSQ